MTNEQIRDAADQQRTRIVEFIGSVESWRSQPPRPVEVLELLEEIKDTLSYIYDLAE